MRWGRHKCVHGEAMRGAMAVRMMGACIMVSSTVISLLLLYKLVRAAEVVAASSALDELEGQLSDAERSDLEARIREGLFS